MSPLDENGIPYKVRITFSYKAQRRQRTDTYMMPSARTRWTFDYLPSGVPVQFSLAAINKKSKAGPTLRTIINTK